MESKGTCEVVKPVYFEYNGKKYEVKFSLGTKSSCGYKYRKKQAKRTRFSK